MVTNDLRARNITKDLWTFSLSLRIFEKLIFTNYLKKFLEHIPDFPEEF